jgi:glycosyltransferase involved in cell wall biosynthesis
METQKDPLITIVTPSYNQGQFIEETILSVLNQTYKNIQYILVDGDSTDKTMEIVDKYSDRIDIIIHEKDKGQSNAINKGFRMAKGELVGWINSDDILYPDCVEKIVELYKYKKDGAIYYSVNNDRVDYNGQLLSSYTEIIHNRKYLLNLKYDVIQPSSFYKTELVAKIGYLNESIHYCMDLDLWLRLLRLGNIYGYNKKSLSAFRIWEATKTSTGGHKFLQEIRRTLLKNGSSFFSPNIRRTIWYEFKVYIKKILRTFL